MQDRRCADALLMRHTSWLHDRLSLTREVRVRGTGGERSKGQAAAGEPVVIKKYANRRLYNTARSCYVTLEDLAHMVREGQDFVVYDAKTGEDITRSVLTQIIFEEESKGQSLLPMGFLRELIRLYGDTLQSVVPGYLEASMKAFAENQERLRRAFGAAGPMAGFEALARHNMELFEQAMRMFTPGLGSAGGTGDRGGRSEAETARAREGQAADELEELQRQIREMQDKLDRLSKQRR